MKNEKNDQKMKKINAKNVKNHRNRHFGQFNIGSGVFFTQISYPDPVSRIKTLKIDFSIENDMYLIDPIFFNRK